MLFKNKELKQNIIRFVRKILNGPLYCFGLFVLSGVEAIYPFHPSTYCGTIK